MGYTPNYHESHLIVAAIRILSHRNEQPPNPEEVAEFLAFSPEKTNIIVHELGQRMVLHILESPFDTRVDILDPKPLEALPKEESSEAMQSELEEFTEQVREKKQKIQKMFEGGEMEKKRQARSAKLEEQFKVFKPKKSDLYGLFGAEGDSEDGEDEGVEPQGDA